MDVQTNAPKVTHITHFPKSAIEGEAPYVAKMTITKEIADFWLKTYNHDNRPITETHLKNLIHQQKEGRWIDFNGDTISFKRDGMLNNGQNRLSMVSATGIPIKTFVVLGVNDGSFKVTDSGKNRTGADTLAIEGVKNYAQTSAAISLIIQFKRRFKVITSGRYGGKVFNYQISDFAKENKKMLTELIPLAIKYNKQGDKLLPISNICAFLYLFAELDKNVAKRFIYELCTGDNVSIKNPVYLLRKKLSEAKSNPAQKLRKETMHAFIIKTWNATVTGQKMKILKYGSDHAFPQIKSPQQLGDPR